MILANLDANSARSHAWNGRGTKGKRPRHRAQTLHHRAQFSTTPAVLHWSWVR